MKKKKCINCKYWKDRNWENEGECYCHPPTMIDCGDGHKSWKSAKPVTNKDDWCGQFKIKQLK